MLGQPVSMLIPQVVGFRLEGELAGGRHRDRPGAHRHRDAARARRGRQVRRVLRHGPGEPAAGRPRHDRQHVARVRRHLRRSSRSTRRRSATCEFTGRPAEQIELVEAYTQASRASSTTRAPRTPPSPTRSSSISPRSCPASPGPSARRTAWRSRTRRGSFLRGARRPGRRPAERRKDGDEAPGERSPPATRRRRWPAGDGEDAASPPHGGRRGARRLAASRHVERRPRARARARRGGDRRDHQLHQHLQPVGDARRRACWRRRRSSAGFTRKPWVKTSLAPGSKVVTDYLERAGLTDRSRAARLQSRRLRLHHLHRQLGAAARGRLRGGHRSDDLVVCSVLSGNRNFEGRIHPDVQDELPGLAAAVVAYALAGSIDIDIVAASRSARAPTASRSTCATSGPRSAEIQRRDRVGRRVRHVPQAVRRGLRGRRALAASSSARGRPLRLGRASPPTSSGRPTSTACPPRRRRASTTSRARVRSRCSATASRPTTSRRPGESARTRRPGST